MPPRLDDPPPRHLKSGRPEAFEERSFDYSRTVALSDGVFAIALTLLVLTITTPELRGSHERLLGRELLARAPEFASYVISFAVLSLLWVRHHRFFRGLDRIDTRATALNLLYLGLVALLPYPTHILGLYGDQPTAVVLYAATVAVVSGVAGAMRVHALRAELLSESGRRELERREHWALIPTVFLLSIPLAFLSTTAAMVFWLLTALPRFRPFRARVARPRTQEE
jgi:uncharacterized membrane protein